MKNILLKENPQKGKTDPAYILPKVQESKQSKLGKKHSNVRIKNTTDKSVVRHIKKKSKK